jgi:quinoprotein glucose dehydrogenase
MHGYDARTGELLWEAKLPDVAYSNPITFEGADGKQYVVINANGSIVAYRLP